MQYTYLNPVHNRSCPDPFVLKYRNEYWCYCTGLWSDGRYFGILHSRDLVHWQELNGALEPLDDQATCYWAPEVINDNGAFLMYYSVGNEERMQIRVAKANHPAGPFVDSGICLTTEDFAIDAHVFIDDDGTRWMFYATDFLAHYHLGTGTVCDKMIDPFTLAGNPRPVTRARYDWQIYDPQRKEKGDVRWYTVEGPFVLKHKGRYYQMFSSGNWQQASYGVSYAITDRLETPEEWEQSADGEQVLPILRTVPERVIGPGHNSVVRGPDNQQLFCVYHRWSNDAQARVLAIDPLEWAGDRMLVLGPSYSPQPLPLAPLYADYFDADESAAAAQVEWCYTGGKWKRHEHALQQTALDEAAEATCFVPADHFIVEVSLRVATSQTDASAIGIKLSKEEAGAVLLFNLLPQTGQAVVAAQVNEHWSQQHYDLPPAFNFSAFHLLRLEMNSSHVRISLDGNILTWEGKLEMPVDVLVLTTSNASAEFAGLALTHGWQDFFVAAEEDPRALEWQTTSNDDRWRVGEQHLWFIGPHGEASILTKGPLPADYELVINAKLMTEPEPGAVYGFYPALGTDEASPLLTVERQDVGWVLVATTKLNRQLFALPSNFDPAVTQQFRFRKENALLTLSHEATWLGELAVPAKAILIGLYGFRVIAAFDMVRVTAL